MTTIDKRYLTFYLQGREDVAEGGVEAEFDLEALAEQVLAGGDIFDTTRKAASKALAYLETTTDQREWVDENHADLDDLDLNPDTAYKAFSAGRVDEVRYLIEADLVAELLEMDADDDGEGEGEDSEPRDPGKPDDDEHEAERD